MNSKLFIIICLSMVINKPAENSEKHHTSQGIIMILDQNNAEYYAQEKSDKRIPLSRQLYFAIRRNTHAPILFSKSLAKHVFKKILQNPFKTEDFIIKEIEDFYFMCHKDCEQLLSQDIQWENLKNVAWDSLVADPLPKSNSAIPFTKVCEKLFSKRHYSIEWIVYMVGHGDQEAIADLSIEEFKTFSHFLNRVLNTKLLLCMSCYATSHNQIKVFTDTDKSQYENNIERIYQMIFNFPIIFFGTSSKATLGSMTVGESIDFDYLFTALSNNNQSMPDYYDVLKRSNVMNVRQNEFINMPQIRLPHTEWFSIANLNTDITKRDYFVISRIQGRTRTKILHIPDKAKAVFLYSPAIPFPLVLPDNNTPPKIIIMNRPMRAHFLEIYKEKLLFPELCYLFMPFEMDDTVAVYIDKLIIHHKKSDNTIEIVSLRDCLLLLHHSYTNTGLYLAELEGDVGNKRYIFQASFDKKDFYQISATVLGDHPYELTEKEKKYKNSIPGFLQFDTFKI